MAEQEQYVIEVKALDWIVILATLTKRFDPKGEHTSVIIEPSGSHATFYLDKSAIPAEALAASIGTTAAAVEKASKKIVLMPLKGTKDWPSPNVDYYGMG